MSHTDLEILIAVLGVNAYSFVINVVENGITFVTVVDEGEAFSTALQDEFGIEFSNNGVCVAEGLIRREFDYWLQLNNVGGAVV